VNDEPHPLNRALLNRVAEGLFRRAADAWATNAPVTAERWARAAWCLVADDPPVPRQPLDR
jgi:hypothetical protein